MCTNIKIFFVFSLAFLMACGNKEDKEESSKDPEVIVGNDAEVEEEVDFLITSYMNSQLQASLGKVAAEKSSSPVVREFADTIVVKNELVKSNIEELAAATGVQLTPALSPEHVTLLDSIQSYSGDEFDNAFIALFIEEHEDDIERFTKLAADIDNPITRELVTANLEMLEGSLKKAKEVQKAIENE